MWCPKHRRRLLGGRVAERLDDPLDEIAAGNGWEIAAREVTPDHACVLVRDRSADSPAEVVRRRIGHQMDQAARDGPASTWSTQANPRYATSSGPDWPFRQPNRL